MMAHLSRGAVVPCTGDGDLLNNPFWVSLQLNPQLIIGHYHVRRCSFSEHISCVPF